MPWLGTFVYQAQHTGTPWGDPQLPFSALRQALDQFSGGTSIFHGESNIMGALLVVLLVLGGFGAATGARHVDLDVRTRPAVRWELAAALGALVVGLVFAYVSGSAFDGRYAAMMFPLLLFVVAFGFTVFQSSRRDGAHARGRRGARARRRDPQRDRQPHAGRAGRVGAREGSEAG